VLFVVVVIMVLQPLLGLGRFFSFLILYTVGRTPWTGDQPVARPLPAHRTTQTQTSMPGVGFEFMTPVFERANTVHALDHAATVIGHYQTTRRLIPENSNISALYFTVLT
jgi:hypothetical protein